MKIKTTRFKMHPLEDDVQSFKSFQAAYNYMQSHGSINGFCSGSNCHSYPLIKDFQKQLEKTGSYNFRFTNAFLDTFDFYVQLEK